MPNSSFRDSDFASSNNTLAIFGSSIPEDQTGKWELTVWLVDVKDRKLVRTIRLPEVDHSVNHFVRITRDGKRLVTATDADVRVWDVTGGAELIRQKHSGPMSSLSVSPDGQWIAFGHFDVFSWRWESGEEPKKIASIGGFGTELIQFGPDNKTLYVAPSNCLFKVLEIPSGRELRTLDVLSNPRSCSPSPDGKLLAVAYFGKTDDIPVTYTITVWNLASGEEHARFSTNQAEARHVSWSPDGSRLVATTDYRLWTWDVKTGRPLGQLSPGHEGDIGALAFSSDGRLFTASDDHTIRSWDAVTGKPGLELVHSHWVRGLAISVDGSLVAGSALSNDLSVWDAMTGKLRFKLLGHGHAGGKRVVQFTPDGKRLVAWGDDAYLRIWDMRNGKLLAEHSTRSAQEVDEWTDPRGLARFEMMKMIASASLSKDCKQFAFWDRRFHIVDVETGKELLTFESDADGVTSFSFSPDGKKLAIAGGGKQITTRLPDGRQRHSTESIHSVSVWDLARQKPIWKSKSVGYWAAEIGFTPDGLRVAETTYSEDGHAIRLWDAATGKELGRIDLPHSGGHFAFDRSGKLLAVSNRDTTATLFDLDNSLKPSNSK